MDMVTKWLVTQQLTILTLAIDAIIDVTKQLARNVRLDILQDFRMQSLESDHFRKQHEQHEIEEVNLHQDPLMKRLQELQRQDLAGSLCIACEKY